MYTRRVIINLLIRKENDPKNYRIVLGYQSGQFRDKVYITKATELYKHPNLILTDKHSKHDIGLLKMETPLKSIRPMSGRGVSNELKSICLPETAINVTEDEYAMSAGWGQIDRRHQGLQLGYRKVHSDPWPYHLPYKMQPYNLNVDFSGQLLATVIDNQTFHCGVI